MLFACTIYTQWLSSRHFNPWIHFNHTLLPITLFCFPLTPANLLLLPTQTHLFPCPFLLWDPVSLIRVSHRVVGTLPVSTPLEKMSSLPPATLTAYRFQRGGGPMSLFPSVTRDWWAQPCSGLWDFKSVSSRSRAWSQHSTPLSLLL